MSRFRTLFERWSARRRYTREFQQFAEQSRALGVEAPRWEDRYPCLGDRTASTGFDHHYILHPAWAARILAKTKPREHVDISSSLTFVTQVSAFVPTRFYDFRPAPLKLSGLYCGQADLNQLLFADDSIESLSCMHVIEHVGLGRYGDPLDPVGDRKAMKELQRVLAPGGDLLFVVPVGRPRTQFNAHRIYSHSDILRIFDGLELQSHALIPDATSSETLVELIENPEASVVDAQTYGCGCYWFRKPHSMDGAMKDIR